jgi:hypothetical protein
MLKNSEACKLLQEVHYVRAGVNCLYYQKDQQLHRVWTKQFVEVKLYPTAPYGATVLEEP